MKRLLLWTTLFSGFAMFAADAQVTFPVAASANGRYLQDSNAIPFPILGRTAWFITSLSQTDYQTFLDDTGAKGYTAIEFHVINHDSRGNHPPFAGNRALPFLKNLDGTNYTGGLSGTADLTTPNETYWAFVDSLLDYAESKGLLVFMFSAYAGYLGGSQGWMIELVNNGPDKVESYGQWIATRYAARKNIVWMMGGDIGTGQNSFTPEQTAVERALLTGLQSVPGQQSIYFSAEWNSDSVATDQVDFGAAMTLNGAYSFSGYVTTYSRRGYAYLPAEPAFLLEEPYDEEGPDGKNINGSATQPVRRFQWWGWLSSIGGYISGNGYVWPFTQGWKDHLNTLGAQDMARLNAFIRTIPWQSLVPSGLGGMGPMVIDGGGTTDFDFVTAAATPDKKLLIAYVPPGDNAGSTRTFTIDMSFLASPARARWYNPATARYTVIAKNIPHSGGHVFSTPGDNGSGYSDWVLRLDSH